MSDLARRAAKLIGRIEGWHEDSPLEHVIGAIEEVGTLVSPEDAELLRQVKRMEIDMDSDRSHALDVIERMRIGPPWKVRYDGANGWQTGRGDTLTAALKSALDAAGVPDEKGAE